MSIYVDIEKKLGSFALKVKLEAADESVRRIIDSFGLAQLAAPGTATKVLTGAPIPGGANAVIMYEKTSFTDEAVTLYGPIEAGGRNDFKRIYVIKKIRRY